MKVIFKSRTYEISEEAIDTFCERTRWDKLVRRNRENAARLLDTECLENDARESNISPSDVTYE